MCAVNGFNWSDKTRLYKMNEATSHRGPDDTGIFLGSEVSLGHNRLSIIDLSENGHQPMQNGGGRFTITYNGELYNFKELKKELENDYIFHTQSDTEVILAAYKKWGKECLSHFNGIFAFAIWDRDDKELFIARDQSGVKPLYYFWDGTCFIFSSEIKAILEHDVPRVLNTEAFEHFMRIQYVPEPLTMFKDIHKLPKAHFIILKKGKFTLRKYWDISYGKYDKRTKAEFSLKIRKTITNAIESQLVSDRPVGVFLSGGIDSSIILDSVAKVQKNIKTFSVGFELKESEGREKFNKDFEIAKKTAQLYETDHHELIITHKDVIDGLEEAMWHLDEPITSTTVIPQLKLSEYAQKEVAVVLGGDGGDELFGGYERYRLAYVSEIYQKILPQFLRDSLNGFGKLGSLNTSPGIDHFELFMFQENSVLNQVLNKSVTTKTKDFFREKYRKMQNVSAPEFLMNVDMNSWLVNDSLLRTDKLSMASGLEIRVPFLDREVIELAYKIPSKYKIKPFDTKVILKEAFKDNLPEYLFKEPKRGWFSPAAKWLRNKEVLLYVRDIMSENYYLHTKKLFDFKEIHKVLDNHVEGRKYNLTVLWTILAFQLWARRFNVEIED